jgi:hypothetical protein
VPFYRQNPSFAGKIRLMVAIQPLLHAARDIFQDLITVKSWKANRVNLS